MSQYKSDPVLHMTGIWGNLPKETQRRIQETQSESPKVRKDAWRALEDNDVTVLALALDLIIVAQAASRMGGGPPLELSAIRQAALRILAAPARDGRDRSGLLVAAATHVVALRSLAFAASPDDVGKLVSLAPASGRNIDLISAWILAAKEVLRQVSEEKAAPLAALLACVALDNNADGLVRAQAVLAMAASPSSAIEPHLHAMLGATSTEVRVEAAAALASRDALRDSEYGIIRELLAGKVQTPSMRVREPELRAALQRGGDGDGD